MFDAVVRPVRTDSVTAVDTGEKWLPQTEEEEEEEGDTSQSDQTDSCRPTGRDPPTPCCCGPRYCRSCEVNRCLLLRNIVLCNIYQVPCTIYQAAQYLSVGSASKGTSSCSQARSVEPNNEPIHIKRHDESPVSPTGRTTACYCRGVGGDKSCMASNISVGHHQKQHVISDFSQRNAQTGSSVSAGFGADICVHVVNKQRDGLNKLAEEEAVIE